MFRHAISFVLLMGAVVSCSDPNTARRQFLLTEMRQIEHNYSLVSQELANRQQHVNFLWQRLQEQRAELSDYKRRVDAYILGHKKAVGALVTMGGGAGVAYDPNNEFSNSVRLGAGIAGALAMSYALRNAEEVSQVADQLMQAHHHVRSLKAQIESTQTELSSASQPISALQSSLKSMQTAYESRRAELKSLR